MRYSRYSYKPRDDGCWIIYEVETARDLFEVCDDEEAVKHWVSLLNE